MQYAVILTREARRDLDRLPTHIQKRIIRALHLLAEDPRRQPSRQLEGYPGIRRIHASKDYVVLYTIHDREVEVLVLAAAHRREVYRRL